ncbi:alpha/beta hydrolase [Nocardia sp. NEAU-G5]|uniref:Alpha/beta hydrolase n=2 Tax=Nocardia albiluteola TaxID=2842303 RepID=A0ABS6AWK2_9NOCA|nr:alpha/beta hydrolase [Nocardia albiluteola]
MHLAEAGSGPLVVLLHGFLAYSAAWRHQLPVLAAAGYHAVAPDLRGYGDTEAPEGVRHYTQLHLAGDVIGLLDALGADRAVVVGHDWGAMVAWTTALLRPDRIRAVAGLSVPYVPRGPRSLRAMMCERFGERHYIQHFQQEGPAEAELSADLTETFRRVLYSGSGAAQQLWDPVLAPGGRWLDAHPDPGAPPPWLTPAEFDALVSTFARTGFTGGLNYYRATDLSWELMAAWDGARITVPGLFVYGDRDSFGANAPGLIGALPTLIPGLRETVVLPGCGHWAQQERPAEVNEALTRFLAGL